MQKNTVTVIIPMHNGEKYISRCIESILNQSYKNLEILIIDDNSDDSSAEIIKKYMQQIDNITYIKNEHTLGPANSRNIGIQHTKTEYVLFLDCDDWIDLNCLEKAVEKFDSEYDIDVVIWEIKTAFYHSKTSTRYEYLYNNVLTGSMALSLLSHTIENEFFLSPLLGCKLIRKSLLDTHKIVFPDTIYEDDMFTYLTFMYAKKVALITGSCLYYYQHPESLTHHFKEKNIIDFFKTFQMLYNYVDNDQKESYYKFLDKSLKAMLNNMINTTQNPDMQSYYKSLIFKYFYQNIKVEEYYTYSFSLTI